MKIVAYLVVGPGEADRILKPVLEQLRWVDAIAMCLNNVDAKTEKMVRVFAASMSEHLICQDNRLWGREQWRIKQDFVAAIVRELKPDWCWCLDADELFDPRFDRAMAEKMAAGKDVAWYFWAMQCWNDPNQIRLDLSFPNVRFYKVMPELGLHFQATALHCGLAPKYAYRFGSQSGLWFRHYGLMTREDRVRKIARYDKYDPKAVYKGKSWYDGLRNEKARAVPFEEAVVRLPEFIYRTKPVSLKNMSKDKKISLFINKHGKVVEAVGDMQREQFIKMGYQLQDDLHVSRAPEAPVVLKEKIEAVADAGVKPSDETNNNARENVGEGITSESSASDAPKRKGSGKARGGKKGAVGARP